MLTAWTDEEWALVLQVFEASRSRHRDKVRCVGASLQSGTQRSSRPIALLSTDAAHPTCRSKLFWSESELSSKFRLVGELTQEVGPLEIVGRLA